ncbi:unnamed protein product [Miscanthus lutarioriparius]|uniref:Uncharacterized protein n=1 Tax=Miscanthus lutarioriparius TaxID=422564 RepID=A0A811R0I2_9POAL|nr:unnamed protein product [Miscanthus lutarioriparius]
MEQPAPILQTPSPPLTTTKPVPRAKRGKSLHLFEANLRRSDRLHDISRGFKSPICKDRNCLGCNSDPPLLSVSVVRDLGTSFCKLNPESLTDEKLGAKPNKKGAVGKGKAKKPKKANKDPEDGPNRKKGKK